LISDYKIEFADGGSLLRGTEASKIVKKAGFRVYTLEQMNLPQKVKFWTQEEEIFSAKQFLQVSSSGARIHYLDETEIRFQKLPSRFWLHTSKKKTFKEDHPRGNTQRYFLVISMDADGVSAVQFFKGAITTADYAFFITKLLESESMVNPDDPLVIFHDQASYHRTDNLADLLNGSVTLIQNGVACARINPIELLNNKTKYFARNSVGIRFLK
jgi:hypothetical protein